MTLKTSWRPTARLILSVMLMMFLDSGPSAAEEPLFPAPSGWRQEVIPLPPDFAPEMGWRGREILRFSPGMFKPGSADFFSYVFLLELEEESPDWHTQLPLYYKGLAKAVMKDPALDVSGFRLKLVGPPNHFQGTLAWTEPFATKKPQILYLELDKLSDRRWFVCVSPQTRDHSIWGTMHQIRDGLRR